MSLETQITTEECLSMLIDREAELLYQRSQINSELSRIQEVLGKSSRQQPRKKPFKIKVPAIPVFIKALAWTVAYIGGFIAIAKYANDSNIAVLIYFPGTICYVLSYGIIHSLRNNTW